MIPFNIFQEAERILPNNFKSFAAIDTAAFNNWQNTVTTQERTNTQALDTTTHSNYSPHIDASAYHTNNHGDVPGSYSPAYHSNNHGDAPGSYSPSYHSNNHGDAPGSYSPAYHSNNHGDAPGSYSPSYHSNNHTDNNHYDVFCPPGGHEDLPSKTHVDTNHVNVYQPTVSYRVHENYYQHEDEFQDGHSNYTDPGFHRNSASPHSNSGHTNAIPAYSYSHSNSGHTNYVPAYSYSHSNNGHTNAVPANTVPHTNSGHTNAVPANTVPHTNSGHTNYSPAYSYYYHSNTGFDHQNYIPSKPHLFNIADSQQLKGTVDIGLFAYDKNNDGSGTQNTQSQTIKYFVQVRRIKNLDGTTNVSSWVTLQNWSAQNTLTWNTVDALNTGNTALRAMEGIYEIQATAMNDSISQNGISKSYVGQTQTTTVTIRQNTDPTVSVQNGNEFISFVFSDTGMYSNGTYKDYAATPYPDAPANEQAGLFVSINMTDPDVDNYQKAKLSLKKSDGTIVVGSSTDVVWENGSNIIQSGGVVKKGYAFIPKSVLESIGTAANLKAVIATTDYLDAACTNSAGGNIVQSTISKTDATPLTLNVDVNSPGIAVTPNGNSTYAKYDSMDLSISDDIPVAANIETYYQWTKDSDAVDDSKWSNVSTNNKVATPAGVTGDYYLNIKAVDPVKNTRIIKSNVYKLDNSGPSAVINPSAYDNSKININYEVNSINAVVPVHFINIIDDHTSVANIKMWYSNKDDISNIPTANVINFDVPSGTTSKDLNITLPSDYTKKTIHFQFTDSLGNISYYYGYIKHESIAPEVPVISIVRDNGLYIKGDIININWTYKDDNIPVNLLQGKADIIFTNIETGKDVIKTISGTVTSAQIPVSDIPDGITNVKVRVYNSDNKYSDSAVHQIKINRFNPNGKIITKTIELANNIEFAEVKTDYVIPNNTNIKCILYYWNSNEGCFDENHKFIIDIKDKDAFVHLPYAVNKFKVKYELSSSNIININGIDYSKNSPVITSCKLLGK